MGWSLEIDFEPFHAEVSADEIDDLFGSRLNTHGNHFHSNSTWLFFVLIPSDVSAQSRHASGSIFKRMHTRFGEKKKHALAY